jgi:hypothetical protein
MLLDDHATTTTLITMHDLAILGPGTFAVITDLLLLNQEIDFSPRVEIAQRQ